VGVGVRTRFTDFGFIPGGFAHLGILALTSAFSIEGGEVLRHHKSLMVRRLVTLPLEKPLSSTPQRLDARVRHADVALHIVMTGARDGR
jgi:hypothetical protein